MAELLSVPVKKSTDVDLVKPLRNLLQATYGVEGGHDYGEALAELARLRSNAIWKVFDKSSLDTIYSYYDQLVCLESKIPPQEVQIPFKWKDAFDKGSIFGGRMSLTVSSLSFERVCVLFNMAALQSALAAQQPLDSEDSLKLAAKLLQHAAGIFSHLKGSVLAAAHTDPTPDLQPDTLQALAHLMLAQAQEVIAIKCIRDEMKESMVARVCASCEEMYGEAARALQREPIRSMVERDWTAHVQAKQAAFRGLTQYYQAMACRAAGAVGEEIARLTLAVDQLKSAASKLGGMALLQDSLARAQRRLAEVQRDNDFIYHERIPEAAALEAPGRAAIAKPLPLPARWADSSRDLFGDLVPLQVHQALQASAARRNDIVTAEITKLRESTQLLNGVLASLNLPACLEGAGGGGELPDSIRAKAAAVRDAGGLAELERLAAELPELLQRNREILDEAERMLREEAEADSALRAQFGARWTRTESAKLTEAFRANAAKYAQIIDNAVRADATVKQKLEQHRDSIALLSGADGDLEAGVPAAPHNQGTDAQATATLRRLMQDVESLKAERDAIETELKNAKVDVRERFLAAQASDGGIDEPAISAEALGAVLGPLQARAQATVDRQDALLAQVREAHAMLLAARGGACSRDHALARLCAAHDAYQDLTGNLTEGVKFYNDLTQLLVAFQNKVGDFCFARKTEKEELLKDLTQAASRPAPAPPAPTPQSPPQPSQPATSTAAQLPYPVQPQGMPVPYAAGAVPYPYYAPMPALYNPYATLPFPHHAPRGSYPAQQQQYPQQQYPQQQYQQYPPQYPQYRPQ